MIDVDKAMVCSVQFIVRVTPNRPQRVCASSFHCRQVSRDLLLVVGNNAVQVGVLPRMETPKELGCEERSAGTLCLTRASLLRVTTYIEKDGRFEQT